MKKSKTARELGNEIYKLKDTLRHLEMERRSIFGIEFIDAAYSALVRSKFSFPSYKLEHVAKRLGVMEGDLSSKQPAEFLIDELGQRDWPMTRAEIESVFKSFDQPYDDEDIDACRPDTYDAVRGWESENRLS